VTKDEILKEIKCVMVDAMGVDEDEVVSGALLKADLGVESIDYLDIIFRLEKVFGIKIPRNELAPGEEVFSNPEFADKSKGKFTKEGLAELKRRMPFANFSKFEKNPRWDRLDDIYNVQLLVDYVYLRLETKPVLSK
jgi:acyl carrier protein